MMKNLLIKFAMTITIVFGYYSNLSAADHFTESFTGTLTASYVDGTTTMPSGNWDHIQVRGELTANSYGVTGGAARLKNNIVGGSYLITPSVISVGTISFYYSELNSGGGTFKIQKSINGGAFTDLASQAFSGIPYTFYSFDINDASNNIRIRIMSDNNPGFLIIDEVTLSILLTDPTIATSVASLTGFTYVDGSGPSSEQSYNISGINMDGSDVIITPPLNYEISLTSGSGFATTPITLPAYNGSTTAIYVRLAAGLAINTYNGEIISIAGGGATTVNVTCDGEVTATPPPTLVVNTPTLSGFSYQEGAGPSAEQFYDISGLNLDLSDVIITPPTNYEISLISGSGFASTPITLSAFDGTLTTIFVRLVAGLAINTYNSEIISNAGGGATTVNVTCDGEVTAVVTSSICLTEGFETGGVDPTGWANNSSYYNTGTVHSGSYKAGMNATGDWIRTFTVTDPLGLTIWARASSATSNYTVTLQVSTDDVSYTDITTFVADGANLGDVTDVYSQLSATLNLSGTYFIRFNVTARVGGSFYFDDVEVTCGSSGTATLVVSTSTLSGFSYVEGSGPSTEQSYDISGTNLDLTDVIITPSVNYEISLTSGSGFASTPITLSTFDGTATTIFVRLAAGLAAASYNAEVIANSGGGATTVNVTCNGDVTAIPTPTLIVSTPTLTGFSYEVGAGPSTEQSYDISGTNLDGNDVIITPPVDYEISLTSGSGFALTPITLSAFGGTPTTIYVRLVSGLVINTYNGETITNAGGGAITLDVVCDGEVTSILPPTLIVSNPTLTGFSYQEGSGPSAEQSYNISGTNLNLTDVVITPPVNYEISLTSGSGFANTPITLTAFDGSLTTVYVRLAAALSINMYNGEVISNAGGGATPIDVTCNGEVKAVSIGGCATDLIISEYIEGSSFNKAIEIYNGTGASVDLSSYSLMKQVNGVGAFGSEYIFSGILADGEAYVIVHSSAGAPLQALADTIYGASAVNFSGNDAVALYNTGVQIDVIGVIDQVADWGKDVTLVRKDSITAPSTLFAFSDWNSFAIDDFSNAGIHAMSCGGSSTPTLLVSSSTLNGFTYIEGSGPSVEQSYNISGANLDSTNVIITPPANYEISLTSGTGFVTTPITLSAYYGDTTIIYVRLTAGLTTGLYNAEVITNAGGGANTVNVTCDGEVTGIPTPTLTLSTSTLSGFSYQTGSGPSTEQSYDISGTNLDGNDVIITPPTDYEISLTSGSGFAATPINLSAFDGTATTIFVRLMAGLPVNSYNGELISNAGGGASTQNVTCDGEVTNVLPPTLLVSASNLTGFTYEVGSGPSSEQSYVLSGVNLDGNDVIVSPPVNYEISFSSGSGFVTNPASLTLTTFEGSDTTIFVRLIAGLSIGTYNGDTISHSGGAAVAINVDCDGSVTDIAPTPCIAEGFDLGLSAPAGWTFTNIDGTYTSAGNFGISSPSVKFDATGDTIETPTVTDATELSFWIKGLSTTGSSLLVEGFNDTVWSIVDTIVLDTITTGTIKTYNSGSTPSLVVGLVKFRFSYTKAVGNLAFDDVVIMCSSVVMTPVLATTSFSLTGFTYVEGSGPSTEQSYNISGANLDLTDVIVTPPANYEISLTSGSGFASTPITLTAFDGTATGIFVRLAAGLTTGSYNSEVIAIAGGGAVTVNVTCNGDVTAALVPELIVSASTLTGFTYIDGAGPSSQQSYDLSGVNLDLTDVVITPPANYEISLTSGSGFGSTPITLTTFDGTLTTVYVRLVAGLMINTYNGEVISNSGGGAVTVDVTCDGEVKAVSVSGCATDLFISEYIEGSSNNKALEIYNGTGASVDLSAYSVKKQSNGAGTFGSEFILTGTLADDSTYVIAHSSAITGIKALADTTTTAGIITFNGNDAVALYKTGVQVDVVGIVDQTSNWGADVTLVRKDSIGSPSITFVVTDWNSFAVDTYSDLGVHTMDCNLVGIINPNLESGLSVYPNPSEGSFHVRFENTNEELISYKLMDITGHTVISENSLKSVGASGYVIAINRISTGLYVVQLVTNFGTYSHKVVLK